MAVQAVVKERMNTATIPPAPDTVSTAPPSIRLEATVPPVSPTSAPKVMKTTISPMVPGQITVTASTDDPCTVPTAVTAIMSIPVTICLMVPGLPPVPHSTNGQYPVPAVTVPRKPKVTT